MYKDDEEDLEDDYIPVDVVKKARQRGELFWDQWENAPDY